ncbi:MAG: hypothetical protein Q7S57_05795 [bacterium]|nr:hypothetical protein [bacterium]
MRRFFLGIIGGIIVVAIAYFYGADILRQISLGGESGTPRPTATSLVDEAQSVNQNRTIKTTGVKKTNDDILMAKYVVSERPKEGTEQWTDLYLSSDGIMRTITPPDNVDRTVKPVTDGSNIYYLIENKNIREQGRSLVSVGIEDNKQTLISDSTPLVEPRSVFSANDGKTIAFYLDGTQKKMTELWTYSAEKARKRVSVERLTQNAQGPFWDANGGFLLRDGATVLRGSPNRTGADILPIKLDWKNILSGRSMIPSPGGTQIVYLIGEKKGKDVSAVLLVWDLKENQEREIASFTTDKVEILGWSNSGALVVREGEGDVKIWNITKDAKENYGLEANARSVILAGDGSEISYILPGSTGEKMVSRVAKTGDVVAREVLPALNDVSITGVTSRTDIIQFLRLNVVVEGYSQAAEFPLAKEVIVGYVMHHIREIAAVGEGEAAIAQRVWFTHVPGAIYVDYLVGSTLWRRLIQVDGAGGQASKYTLIGVYAPASGEWVLAKGRNLTDPSTTELYEFDPESEKWLKKDITNIHP